MLDNRTTYYYTFRYLYLDGHRSRTCQPIIRTTTVDQRTIRLDLVLSEDLNSTPTSQTYATIEVFRKREGGEYRLIETIDPDDDEHAIKGYNEKYVILTDDGLIGGSTLDEHESVYVDLYDVHTEVRDRIVRGNVEYRDRDLDLPISLQLGTVGGGNSEGDVAVPHNSNVQLFAKGVFDDNQESFHVPFSNKIDNVKEALAITNYTSGDITPVSDYGLKDLSVFLQVEGEKDTEYENSAIPFSTIELNNINVPTLGSWNEEPSYNNSRPHIFLGWKYIVRRLKDNEPISGMSYWEAQDWCYDRDLDENPSTEGTKDDAFLSEDNFMLRSTLVNKGLSKSDYFPDHIETEVVEGQTLPYHLHAYHDSGTWGSNFSGEKIGIYKLSIADALQQAIHTGDVKVRLTNSNVAGQLSSSANMGDLTSHEADVVGFVDMSAGVNDFYNNEHEVFTVPKENRLYLVLDNDDLLNEVDNFSVVNTSIVHDFEDEMMPLDALEPTLHFEILGVEFEQGDDHSSQKVDGYWHYEGLDGRLKLIVPPQIDSVEDSLIYIGSFTDDISFRDNIVDDENKLRYTGFTRATENNLDYISTNPSNIYEQRLVKSDLDILQDKYPNQLVWSQPTVEGSADSGSRTFLYTSFLDIPTEHGEIIALESVGNDLLVFCERGVAVIKVGEHMASQSTGDIYIDSSQLLNAPVFRLRNVKRVQKYSIVNYEHTVFFCDGKDVWTYNGQFQNVSSGAVPLDGYCVGSIDPKNKEYRISVFDEPTTDVGLTTENRSANTYAYSIELQEWNGPYTYGDINSAFRDDRLVSYVNKHIAEHNRGNTFGGTEYETVIESCANTLGDPMTIKRYRKFMLNMKAPDPKTDELKFVYSSQYDVNPYEVDLAGRRTYNGLYRIGFKSGTNRSYNSASVFWKIKTVLKGFVLRGLSFSYLPLRR